MNVWFEFATQFAYFKLSPSPIISACWRYSRFILHDAQTKRVPALCDLFGMRILLIWPRTGCLDASGDYAVLAAIAENGPMKISVTI